MIHHGIKIVPNNLRCAARQGTVDDIQWLLDYGIPSGDIGNWVASNPNPNVVTQYGIINQSFLKLAIKNGTLSTVSHCIEHCGIVYDTDSIPHCKNLDVLQYLYTNGIVTNIPLRWYIINNMYSHVEWILEVSEITDDIVGIIDGTVHLITDHMLTLLISNGCVPGDNTLNNCIKRRDVTNVRLLYSIGITNINMKSIYDVSGDYDMMEWYFSIFPIIDDRLMNSIIIADAVHVFQLVSNQYIKDVHETPNTLIQEYLSK